jgi:carboxymethylenebutenolidase
LGPTDPWVEADDMVDLHTPWFLTTPAGDGPWPGVVVVHEGNGMSAQLLRFSERLAREGYVTIAPDIFWRAGGPAAGDFAELMGAMKPPEIAQDLAAAVAELQRLGCPKIGLTGFCMGGGITYRTACGSLDDDVPQFDAAVGFYGGGIAQALGKPRCPTLLFFGGHDPWIPPDQIEAVRAHHPDLTFVYPDAGHGFMRDGSGDYHEASATDAWQRLTEHFATHLR